VRSSSPRLAVSRSKLSIAAKDVCMCAMRVSRQSGGLVADLADRADDAGSDDSGKIVDLHRSRCNRQQPGRSQIRRNDYRPLDSAQLSRRRVRVHLDPVSRILGQHAAHTSVWDPACRMTQSVFITSMRLLLDVDSCVS